MRPATQKLIDHVSEEIIYRDVTETELPGDMLAVTFIIDDRQTGKTTRRILRALQELSEGEDVVYVAPNLYTAMEIRDRAARICDAAHLRVDVRKETIRLLANDKTLRFISVDRYEEDENWYRGLPHDMVVILDGVTPSRHPEPQIGRIL